MGTEQLAHRPPPSARPALRSRSIPPPRDHVLGVGVSALSFATASDLVVGVRGNRDTRGRSIGLATVHDVDEARADPSFRRSLNTSWLTPPDDLPLVWLGPPGFARVDGPGLMLAVYDAGRSPCFSGSQPGVADELKTRVTVRDPGLAVVGPSPPPCRPRVSPAPLRI